jgi:hypothetical protein
MATGGAGVAGTRSGLHPWHDDGEGKVPGTVWERGADLRRPTMVRGRMVAARRWFYNGSSALVSSGAGVDTRTSRTSGAAEGH